MKLDGRRFMTVKKYALEINPIERDRERVQIEIKGK